MRFDGSAIFLFFCSSFFLESGSTKKMFVALLVFSILGSGNALFAALAGVLAWKKATKNGKGPHTVPRLALLFFGEVHVIFGGLEMLGILSPVVGAWLARWLGFGGWTCAWFWSNPRPEGLVWTAVTMAIGFGMCVAGTGAHRGVAWLCWGVLGQVCVFSFLARHGRGAPDDSFRMHLPFFLGSLLYLSGRAAYDLASPGWAYLAIGISMVLHGSFAVRLLLPRKTSWLKEDEASLLLEDDQASVIAERIQQFVLEPGSPTDDPPDRDIAEE